MNQLVLKTSHGDCLWRKPDGSFITTNPDAINHRLQSDANSSNAMKSALAKATIKAIIENGITTVK